MSLIGLLEPLEDVLTQSLKVFFFRVLPKFRQEVLFFWGGGGERERKREREKEKERKKERERKRERLLVTREKGEKDGEGTG